MLELWGGHECTVNRTRDGYRDQTVLSGHEVRLDDLDRFAALGCRALRYPVLWERVSPQAPDQRVWDWSDERLARLRELAIRPIVGLVHHGSGPAYTSLLDPGFAAGLAAHAEAVAARYPWVEDWTPVNEPLTTARFSALYGHWHPHVADEALFWTALLNQIDAVRLSMKAVRAINPDARLVQTEDLGRTYATWPLREQERFDNARRWMTWDLLTGRVTAGHALFDRLRRFGLADRLRAIADEPCPPDIVGVNHYLTGERFLDHRLDRYPPHTHGGNAAQAYADVEAVRVLLPEPDGLEGVLRRSPRRYGLPIAVTEVHNGCTREEQMRWLLEAWRTAERLRDEGVAIRAVTAWSLLGAYDWNSLLTRGDGHYEPGVFDLRGGAPRATGLAHLMKALSAGEPVPPAALGEGWWRRDIRLEFSPSVRNDVDADPPPRRPHPQASPPILITGATGTLGRALAHACHWRGLDYVLTTRERLPLSDPDRIAAMLDAERPWAVINAAGWVKVDAAETEEAACRAANLDGAALLAAACAVRGLPFVGFSSDLVFDGAAGRPYREDDPTAPLGAYGRSKADMEQRILAMDSRALIVRTAAFFSERDPHNFASALVAALASGRTFDAADDVMVSPTYTPELADAVLDLLIDGERGVRHLANGGEVSWAQFARMICARLDLDPAMVRGQPAAIMGWIAPRPRHGALATLHGAMLSPLDVAVDRYAAALRRRGAPPRPLAVAAE
jgi:dTDP-4-dehydrorhamnose reductase